MKFAYRSLLFILLTILTQVGGLIYLLSLWISHRFMRINSATKRRSWHILVYIVICFTIVPWIASAFGRVQLPIFSSEIVPHSFITVILQRHYVTKELRTTTQSIVEMADHKVYYLDANFPFWNGFPLLPHLSHNDGKKLDLALVYRHQNIPVKGKTLLGYGDFEGPKSNEFNQTAECTSKGNWWYPVGKYLRIPIPWRKATFDTERTATLIKIISSQPSVQKIFIEPHLKSRFKLSHQKIRFQGCHSVRHDDHIHLQIH